MCIINDMRDAGLQSRLDLPALVFCGNQSAGKSSLTEVLFGIPIPRSHVACTRCVTEIRTRRTSERFSARVSIRWEYDEAVQSESFEVLKELVGSTLRRSEVRNLIEKAQTILLNPSSRFNNSKLKGSSLNRMCGELNSSNSSNSSEMLWNSHKEPEYKAENELKFTRNIICVEIYGPGEGNLVGIDMPGLIRYTEKPEDERYILLIQNITQDYLQNPNTIIVPIISCKDDIENQGIIKLAKDSDPTQERTLPVLTKADAIEDGCHSEFIDILLGKVHRFKLGFFLTKCATKLEREMKKPDHLMVRRMEEQFFFMTPPWSLAPADIRQRLGSAALGKCLGRLLTQKINEQLPVMKHQVFRELQHCCSELRSLPEIVPEENMKQFVLGLITKLGERTKAQVDSTSRKDLWISVCNQFSKFMDALRQTSPKFDLLEETVSNQSIKDDFQDKNATKNSKSIQDIQEIIENVRGRQLKGSASYDVKRVLIKEFVDKWSVLAHQLITNLGEIMGDEVQRQNIFLFQRFPKLKLESVSILARLLKRKEESAHKYVDMFIQMERRDPFTVRERAMQTLESNYYQSMSKCLESKLTERKRPFQSKCEGNHSEISNVRFAGKAQVTKKESSHHSGEILNVMAMVRAYFDISHERFGDDVCRQADHILLEEFSNEIKSELCLKLGILEASDDELRRILSESEEISLRRAELRMMREKLEPISHALQPIQSQSIDDIWPCQ
uniref:P-loop containing nucleoside triphosphate hydrolase protein n=1 Tax=Hirondellea gigas TaxID=1518452 RepID=A0A6A7G541_9CRUS